MSAGGEHEQEPTGRVLAQYVRGLAVHADLGRQPAPCPARHGCRDRDGGIQGQIQHQPIRIRREDHEG